MRKLLLLIAALGLAAPRARAETTDAVLDSLQFTAFQYFWNESNATTGLIRDRNQSGSPCSIASQGFGLSAICIGIDHGWVPRAQGAARVRTALQTYWTKPQGTATSGTIGYKGFFYHFLELSTGNRMPGWNPELSSIDTALLLAGILDAKQYFDGPDTNEVRIRAFADSIYRRVDWVFMKAADTGVRHGWNPNGGAGTFLSFKWIGYDEAMILYILALGSPTFPVPSSDWAVWTSGYNWQTQYGQSFVIFPPLFGHQYSHCWIDFRNQRDAYMTGRGIDYFENSRRATLAQQAYCIANPLGRTGYGPTMWGITAGDGPPPINYRARGAPPAQDDDGTITPTAVIGSLPFAPEICLPTIQNWYDNYKAPLWTPYGFRDGFNLTVGWAGPDVIGIDQGPIIVMIENYRTGAVWNRFMRNPEIQTGLARAGFVRTVGVDPTRDAAGLELSARPTPFTGRTSIDFTLARASQVRITVHDVTGREVARVIDGWRAAGRHAATFVADGLPSGVYWVELATHGAATRTRIVLVR